MIFYIFLFATTITQAGCTESKSTALKNPTRSPLIQLFKIPDEQSPLCTDKTFNFLTHFIVANGIYVPPARNPYDVVDFMKNNDAIPVLKRTDDHSSKLRIDRFVKCSRSKDATKAIRDEGLRRASPKKAKEGNLSNCLNRPKKRKPTPQEWENIRQHMIHLRNAANPKEVQILHKKLKDYYGRIESNDSIISVYTEACNISLTTALRLQGRIVGFAGPIGSRGKMTEIDLDYAVDSVTEKEFKILYNSDLHITSEELEQYIYGTNTLPDLTQDTRFDTLRTELETKVNEIAKIHRSRFTHERGQLHARFDVHDATVLELLADLNPDAKFLMFKGSGNEERFGDPDTHLEPTLPFFLNHFISLEFMENAFNHAAKWLRERKVKNLVMSYADPKNEIKANKALILEIASKPAQRKTPIYEDLIVNEKHLPLSTNQWSLNHNLAHFISDSTHWNILKLALSREGIRVFQGLRNIKDYRTFFDHEGREIEQSEELDAEIVLIAEHLSPDSNLRGRQPSSVIMIAATGLGIDQQTKILKGGEPARSSLTDVIFSSHWSQNLHWAMGDFTIDQGDSFQNFEGKSWEAINLSYHSFFRAAGIWNTQWWKSKPKDFKEVFRGIFYPFPSFKYVSHGTTSFSNPIAASLILEYFSSLENIEAKNYYLRPFLDSNNQSDQ
jgi:hypothetical protein